VICTVTVAVAVAAAVAAVTTTDFSGLPLAAGRCCCHLSSGTIGCAGWLARPHCLCTTVPRCSILIVPMLVVVAVITERKL
jgi:hypothetical protein